MADPIQLLPHGGRIPVGRTAMLARVSRSQPLPTSFASPLYVTLDYDPDHAIAIVNWPALHGATLPAGGADVLLVEDDQHGVRVAWWDGAHTDAAPSGTVGGDLSGMLPNPTVAKVLGGQTPITTTTALGGALTGTLPNPGLASASTVARAYRAAAYSFPATGLQVVPVDTATDDPGANFTLASHYYVVASAGRYLVAGQVAANIGAANFAITLVPSILKNGLTTSQGAFVPQSAADSTAAGVVTDILNCAAGDHLQLGAFVSGTWALAVASSNNYLSVVRVA